MTKSNWLINATRRGRQVCIGTLYGTKERVKEILQSKIDTGEDWQVTAFPFDGCDKNLSFSISRDPSKV